MKQIALLLVFATFLFSGCKEKGCTDPKARNFSYEADVDDGSCDYSGCMDENALNYDPDAREDDGSCIYLGGLHFVSTRTSLTQSNVFLAIEINDQYIGNIGYPCSTPFPDCNTVCSHAKFTEQPSGSYYMEYWEIRQISSTTFDTLYIGQPETVNVIGGECNVFSIK